MNKLSAVAGLLVLAFTGATFAQDGSDAARQARMDRAYSDHREGLAARTGDTVREDTHRAGHAIHNGVRETGHAVHSGVRATGHAIHRGVRATGHAIHRGVDKITGN